MTMAIIRKSELKKMNAQERASKIAELEKAMLELRGEGKKEKTKPLRKAIAKLLTWGSIEAARAQAKAHAKPVAKSPAPEAKRPVVVASVEKRK
jgi:ribosomal protein L29